MTVAQARAFRFVEFAQKRWHVVNVPVPHLIAQARAGARFERGRLAATAPAVAA
ncbi:hypothetical protein AB0F18_14730 [Streptomyces sp. NPDC029216]|uniref:hypothetical protein n=1 Tax=Streptomyces sp. NPDC029216 TaxID=3154701 RepID=UPI0033F32243